MTPTAVTPAAGQGRSATARPASPQPTAPRAAHRTPLQRSASPASPRRVSGPARPTTRPRPTPHTRPTARPRPTPRTPGRGVPALGARALARLRTLPDHLLLDRVVRGRLWIPLLGVLLVGIVAMQVEVLKLNADIGRSTVRAGQLQGEDQLLRMSVSRLADDQRIESAAAQMGMAMPAPSTPRFLPSDAATNLTRALTNIHQPDPAGFAATTSANAAAAAASTETTVTSG